MAKQIARELKKQYSSGGGAGTDLFLRTWNIPHDTVSEMVSSSSH
jgi:hypothetical protein